MILKMLENFGLHPENSNKIGKLQIQDFKKQFWEILNDLGKSWKTLENLGLHLEISDKLGEIVPRFPGRSPGFLNFLAGILDFLDNLLWSCKILVGFLVRISRNPGRILAGNPGSQTLGWLVCLLNSRAHYLHVFLLDCPYNNPGVLVSIWFLHMNLSPTHPCQLSQVKPKVTLIMRVKTISLIFDVLTVDIKEDYVERDRWIIQRSRIGP